MKLLTSNLVAVSVLVVGGLISVGAEETNIAVHSEQQPQQLKSNGRAPSASEYRLHPAYQVFASQLPLPPIIGDKRTLNIGGRINLDLSQPDLPLTQEKIALAEQLQVAPVALNTLVQELSTNTQLNGEQLAEEFRTAIIDYKYLEDRWARYRPADGNEAIKQEALKSLQAGEIEKVWRMFATLPRPKPPTGLRVRGQ